MKKLKLFFALFAMLALGVGNAWAEEEYALYSGTITEGDYVIVYNDNAMNNTVSSSRLGYTAVTITGDKISNPATTIVWHIAPSGDYWTIFSANVNKYAASTGAKNKAQLLASGTDNKSLWTVTGSSTYEFVNKANETANVNKNLRQNGTYGFACYATSTGGALSLYKKVEQSGGGETTEPEPEPEPDPTPDPGTGGESGSYTWDLSKKTYTTGTNEVTWTCSIATMHNTGTNATNYLGADANNRSSSRFYNGNTLTITPASNISISSVVFIATSTNYADVLNNSTWDNASASVSSTTVTVTPTNGTNAISAKVGGTCGFTGVTVHYTKATSGEPEPEKTATSLVWSQTEYAVTMGEAPTFPTLTTTPADLTGVTYSSSNGAVATIAADGTITINAVGETTIKASYAGNEIYAAATDATYKLTVNKAPATETENVYVKVTSTEGITNGEYLIVYEDAANNPKSPVAFNGALATLDAAKNTVAVAIDGSTIAGNTDIDAALFTIDVTAGTLKSASGKYIGVSSNSNGLKTEDVAKDYKNAFSVDNGNAVIAADFEGSTMSLRYNNTAGDNNLRFRYYKNAGQQPIALYKKVDPNAVVEPIFTLVAGEYYGTQSVTISCATAGAEVYYTLDGTDPTSESTKYTGAISIASTTTVKAIAVKGANSSAVVSATYTILAPLATMQAIFDKATEIGKDAVQSVKITFDEWVISAVVPGKDEKPSSNAYITDGDKGFIIYTSTGHGFKVGDKLSGTITCDLTLYNGSAEVKGLISTTTGLTVVENGTITPVELNATQIEELSGVNTGSVIKITGPCTVDGTKYYVADVQLYNSLYSYTDLTAGNKYNVTGVYLQYNAISEILPRSEADIEEIIDLPTATISIANITMEVDEEKTIEATITPDAAKTTVVYSTTSECITISGNTITATAVGTATVTATIAEKTGEYYGATKDFTVTVTPKSTKDKVVILAEYDGKWYAMMAQYVTGKNSHLAALKVDYVGGKLYNVSDENKALIEWTRAVVDGKATFYNDGKYLTGKSDKTDLTLAATACEWAIDGSSYLQGDRTFFYNAENNWFRNFKTSNAEETNYSALPVVTAPVYETGEVPFEITTTAENGTAKGGGVYKAGEKVTLTADPAMDYTFVSWTKGGEVVSTANPFIFEATENLDLVANFQEITATTKTLSGKFSTGIYEYAEFATGNLQYHTGNKTWRFAKQQYQVVGDANINIGDPNYKGWIDMFGWSNGEANNFGVNPSFNKDDYKGKFENWGTKMGEGWLTLTDAQWNYLLYQRANASKLKQIAMIGEIRGIMLFPDEWNGTMVEATYDDELEVNVYKYDLTKWAELEAQGVIFMPAAGRRFGGYGNTVQVTSDGKTALQYGTNYFAAYWTSTKHSDGERASYLINLSTKGENNFVYSNFTLGWYEYGYVGQSVRLAKVTDITPVVIRDGLTVGQWGTLCPTQNVATPTGATFYQIAYLEEKDGLPFNMYFDQIKATTLTAGEPYFFIASATEIKGVKSGEVKTAGDNANGFYGYIDETDAPWELPFEAEYDVNKDNTFVIWNNSVFRINAATKIKSERCYIIINKTQPSRDAVSVPAGARRITMGVSGINGQNTATGMENVDASAQPVKTIINGQLYILRGEKMYDAQGKLVK